MSVLTFDEVYLELGTPFAIVWLLMLFFFVIFFCPGWKGGGIGEEGDDGDYFVIIVQSTFISLTIMRVRVMDGKSS